MSERDAELMSIQLAERFATDSGEYNAGRFLAMFPSGPRECKWLDAYFGLFTIEGMEGFVRVVDIEEACPNLQVMALPPQEVES